MEDSEETKETQECDMSAYILFHEGALGFPCLSFDVVKDNLGEDRSVSTPVSCTFVAGTQGPRTHVNNIILMKLSKLSQVVDSSDSETEDDDDDKDDEAPASSSVSVNHKGCVNRIRATKLDNANLAASWSEIGEVYLWDLSKMLNKCNEYTGDKPLQECLEHEQPLFSFKGHSVEGFALDWSKPMPGHLASGDCNGNIYIWQPRDSGAWAVDNKPCAAHKSSVEDIQWSPNEPHVFASCSVDRSIRIWDSRVNPNKACKLTCSNAHQKDVNVINWNSSEPFIVSGGDDCALHVWDLRQFESCSPVATFKYHTKPVTTVEWHPLESSVFASGDDTQILQWDLAVEKDTDQMETDTTDENDKEEDAPDQLLFIHKGQQDVKELHWHPQIPGLIISTAHSGFNIFKTISC